MTGDRGVAEMLDLVDAAVYADLFDAAVTLDTLRHFARVRIDQESLTARLNDDPVLREAIAVSPSSLITLARREDILVSHVDRAARAERLRRRAVRVGRALRHVPFVRGVLLTGSVAAGAAPEAADVDLIVLVGDGRLGTVFALLGSVSRLIGRRVFCPNFYLSDSHLGFQTRNIYVGHELGQARSVVGDAAALRDANPWLVEMFPNLPTPEAAPVSPGSALQAVLEAVLRGRAGRAFEARARGLALSRLGAHYGGVPVEIREELARGESLRFHASGVEHSVPHRHAELRAALAARLSSATEAQAGRSS